MPNLPFKVGSIDLTDFEAGTEGLGDLGGEMRLAIYEYAGGLKTAQYTGAFPGEITWKGSLRGAGSHDRALELDELRKNPQVVPLTYSNWTKQGILKKFEAHVKHAWHVDYQATFEVMLDETTSSGATVLANNAEDDLNNALSLLNSQLNAPASFAVPPVASQPINQIQAQTNQALQNAGGLSNVSPGTIQSLRSQISSAISTLKSAISSLGASTDGAAQVSGASDLIVTLQAVDVILAGKTTAIDSISIENPNLYSLASAYYGDWGKWELIADANGLNKEPMPTGFFERLVIPFDNTVYKAPPVTLI